MRIFQPAMLVYWRVSISSCQGSFANCWQDQLNNQGIAHSSNGTWGWRGCSFMVVSQRKNNSSQALPKKYHKYWLVKYSSTQIIATSYDLTLNGGLVREIPLFQGSLGWWNIIIWPDSWFTLVYYDTLFSLGTLTLSRRSFHSHPRVRYIWRMATGRDIQR